MDKTGIMKLYSHQQDIVDKKPRRAGLWWQTGTGKSFALIALVNTKKATALFVCPKSIKQKWIDDLNEHCTQPFTVLTKEEFRRDWEKIPHHDALVIDEAHHYSSPKSQMHKSSIKWCKKNRPTNIWLATATPYRSTPWNVYAMYSLLGRNLPWKKFRDDFFREQRMGHRIIYVPDESKKPTLQALLRDIGSLVTLDECVDMPEAIFEYETIPLTKEQNRAINELEEENPVVRYGKMHQIENGTLKGNEFENDVIFKDNKKVDRIIEIADTTSKVAIFAKYNLQVQKIANALEQAGHTVFQLTGGTKDEHAVISEAENTSECCIVINAEKAEGYELPSFRHIVYASLPWSLVSWTQSQGRFRRINNLQRVHYTVLTADGKVDKAVKHSLDNKVDFQIELYARKESVS